MVDGAAIDVGGFGGGALVDEPVTVEPSPLVTFGTFCQGCSPSEVGCSLRCPMPVVSSLGRWLLVVLDPAPDAAEGGSVVGCSLERVSGSYLGQPKWVFHGNRRLLRS